MAEGGAGVMLMAEEEAVTSGPVTLIEGIVIEIMGGIGAINIAEVTDMEAMADYAEDSAIIGPGTMAATGIFMDDSVTAIGEADTGLHRGTIRVDTTIMIIILMITIVITL